MYIFTTFCIGLTFPVDFPGVSDWKDPAGNALDPGSVLTLYHVWVRKIPLENGMAALCSVLAWRIPGIEAPVHGSHKELDMIE